MARGESASGTALLTVPEVMARLRLGRTAVYGLIRSGRLASLTIGRARRVPLSALRDFIANETGEVA